MTPPLLGVPARRLHRSIPPTIGRLAPAPITASAPPPTDQRSTR